jgi:putative lipase involved disintegration of autophagic bodies
MHRYFFITLCAALLVNKIDCLTMLIYNATTKPVVINGNSNYPHTIAPGKLEDIEDNYRYAKCYYAFQGEKNQLFSSWITYGVANPVVIFETEEDNPKKLKKPYALTYDEWWCELEKKKKFEHRLASDEQPLSSSSSSAQSSTSSETLSSSSTTEKPTTTGGLND